MSSGLQRSNDRQRFLVYHADMFTVGRQTTEQTLLTKVLTQPSAFPSSDCTLQLNLTPAGCLIFLFLSDGCEDVAGPAHLGSDGGFTVRCGKGSPPTQLSEYMKGGVPDPLRRPGPCPPRHHAMKLFTFTQLLVRQ